MRLCLALGGMTFAEFLRRIDEYELELWMAFEAGEPIPQPWRQTGRSIASMANLASGKKYREEQFMPTCKSAIRQLQSPEDMLSVFTNAKGKELIDLRPKNEPKQP